MKNIIKSISLLAVMSVCLSSCILDDEAFVDDFNDLPNFSKFNDKTKNVSAVATGDDVLFPVVLNVTGPTMENVNEDVTVTIAVDAAASTAIEGTHYTLDQLSVTLKSSENYIGSIPLTVITNGIVPPLAENPILTLKIVSTTGNGVISSDSTVTLQIVYQCFADLTGNYVITNDFCSPNMTGTIAQNPDGSWFLSSADGWFLGTCTGNDGLANFGNITELCGDILPSNDLEYGDLPIGTITGGTWDSVNGILTMTHTEAFFTNGPYAWTSTYVRQ